MYFVYFLHSLKNGDIYVGSTKDVQRRLKLHNSGKVRSTKGYRPWELLDSLPFESRSEAVKEELSYKTGQQKELLRIKYGAVAK